MKIIIQRVREAQVHVRGELISQIGQGMLVFLGVEKGDTQAEVEYFVRKIAEIRMFEDADGKMNLSAADVSAGFLIVSQFTLCGDCNKGRRPSFDRAAEPEVAKKLYQQFVDQLRSRQFDVATGEFQAMMDVSLVNDGPVTFTLEGKAR